MAPELYEEKYDEKVDTYRCGSGLGGKEKGGDGRRRRAARIG
jgi:hypothetical protein